LSASGAAMKTLPTMLILLLLLHLQCGGSCLAESLDRATQGATDAQPPCHQHGQTPTNKPQQSSHHVEGTCAQAPVIEAKLDIGKAVLQLGAILPDVITASQPNNFEMHRYIPDDLRSLLLRPSAISVLRI